MSWRRPLPVLRLQQQPGSTGLGSSILPHKSERRPGMGRRCYVHKQEAPTLPQPAREGKLFFHWCAVLNWGRLNSLPH